MLIYDTYGKGSIKLAHVVARMKAIHSPQEKNDRHLWLKVQTYCNKRHKGKRLKYSISPF